MSQKPTIDAIVKMGADLVTIRRKGVSSTVIAKILGRHVTEDGTQVITLDRLVHRNGENSIGNTDGVWSVNGAFVSVLSREVAPS